MAARENALGLCRCPVCDSRRASLRLSAKQLAYLVCDACNVQIFARSDRSDERLRASLIPEAPAPAPVAAPVPAAPVAPATKPAQAPAMAAPAASPWGFFK